MDRRLTQLSIAPGKIKRAGETPAFQNGGIALNSWTLHVEFLLCATLSKMQEDSAVP